MSLTIRLLAVQKLALEMLRAHALAGWKFGFNRRRRALGICHYDKKRIELSVHFVARNDEPAIRDVILHEIAHAMAGHAAGHGQRWKAICRAIGAKPERCDTKAAMPPGKWNAACPGCGKPYSRHRRPLRNRTYSCKECGRERGVLQFKTEVKSRVSRRAKRGDPD